MLYTVVTYGVRLPRDKTDGSFSERMKDDGQRVPYLLFGTTVCSLWPNLDLFAPSGRGGIRLLDGPCRRLQRYPGSVWRAQIRVGSQGVNC